MMKNIRKIDIHSHITPLCSVTDAVVGNGIRVPNRVEMLELYEKLNIEKGVLLPQDAPELQWARLSSESAMQTAHDDPQHFLWFCSVAPTDAELEEKLRRYKQMGAKGVGEITAHLYADDASMGRLFAACEALDMPVLIHMAARLGAGYGVVDDFGLPRLEKVLKKHPKLKLIGHSQPFWTEMSADITESERGRHPTGKVIRGRLWELMQRYENLYCDLSAGSGANAMMRDAENAAAFMQAFSNRILYGCDLGGTSYSHQFALCEFLEKLRASGKIREETYRKIVRENAERLLKITVKGE